MYKLGQKVIYGIHGVCSITDIEHRSVDRKDVTYLVLEPAGQSGSRYLVPTHNQAAMSKLSPILSRDELEQLINSPAVRENVWITDENARKQHYRQLINSSDRTALMRMCATLYRHREQQTASGRKVHMCDDNFLRDAEKLLCSEISVVMELDYEQARSYLRSFLNK